MLRRVRIRGYKSLRDVEVRFDRPLSVIIGANASGKSNLFDALALLSRMVTKNSLFEAFEGHRGSYFEAFSFDEEGIEGLLNRSSAEFSIEVDFELSPSTIEIVRRFFSSSLSTREIVLENKDKQATTSASEKANDIEHFLRYSITIQINTNQGYLRPTHEKIVALNDDFTEKVTFVERNDDRFRIKMGYTGMEGIASSNSPIFFEPAALSFSPGMGGIQDIRHSPIIAVQQEISRWRFYDLEPSAMREPIGLRNVTALSANGNNLPAFFNTMKVDHPKHFESIRRALHLLIPEIEAFDLKRDMEGYLYLFVREHGTEYSSRVISDGTLRILALLAATNPLEPTTLLGIEEPENGVDPHRLRFIADLLKTTTEQRGIQVLVNTHSPLLPRYFSEDNLIYCWRTGGETVFEPVKTSGLWRDPLAVERRLSISDEDEQAAPLTTTS